MPGGDSVWVVRARGALDGSDHPAIGAVRRPDPDCDTVVVELLGVPRVTAAALKALTRCAKELADHGRGLLLVGGRAAAGELLDDFALPDFPSAEAALALPPVGAAGPVTDDEAADPLPGELEVRRLRAEVRDLRARARAHPQISRALGVLEERYGLPLDHTAFELLKKASQRHNVRMRALAAAVVAYPRPERAGGAWFPGRLARPAPPLPFAGDIDVQQANVSAVLGSMLRHVLDISATGMGNVQLVEPVRGHLRIEKHQGLTDDFVTYFDEVGRDGTSCALAAQQTRRVTVTDVEHDPVFTDGARQAILAAGSRGCHSTPLLSDLSDRHQVLGMVSSHHDAPVGALTNAQAAALDEAGRHTGRWLHWHRHTVLLDALDELHRLAVSRSRSSR
nr:ANTAR domain-containing protein [Streptomyces coryli]